MLYALLCYNDEDVVWSWSAEKDAEIMDRIRTVQDELTAEGKLGPSLRLLPTTAATTVRKSDGQPLIIDGPFAETKEQLLGFYIIDVENLDAALEVVRRIGAANPSSTYEVRPIALFVPNARQATATPERALPG